MKRKKTPCFDIETAGFYRIAASSPKTAVADTDGNVQAVLNAVKRAEKEGVNLILFPQLTVTGCSCGVLFTQSLLLQRAEQAVKLIAKKTAALNIISVAGFPFLHKNRLYSTAAVIAGGKIRGLVPLPPSEILRPFFEDYDGELAEIPFFEQDDSNRSAEKNGTVLFGKEIDFFACKTQDTHGFSFAFHRDSAAHVLLMPVAEPSFAFSASAMKNRYKELSLEKRAAAVFANCGAGESAGEFVFAGECGIFEQGSEAGFSSILTCPADGSEYPYTAADIDAQLSDHKKRQARLFGCAAAEIGIACSKKAASETCTKTLKRTIPQNPFLPGCDGMHRPFIHKSFFYEIIRLQAAGLAKRLTHIHCKKCVLGISGGLDSSLALLAARFCFKNLNIPGENIYAVTMPGFGTTKRTKNNARALAELLGCTVLEIPIAAAVEGHFSDIGHKKTQHDTVYENAQARERTQILMDKANQIGGLMIGSGDLSEAALGWMTYSGDHMSMYEVNASIPKTLLKGCITAFTENAVLFDDEKKNEVLKKIVREIIDTPVSPELLPPENGQISQKTEELIGPYELHDFFLYHAVENGFSPKKIYYLALQAFGRTKYTDTEIIKWLNVFYKRFFSQQFKRSCSPDGAAVTVLSLSPRSRWPMPSDSCEKIWIKELEILAEMV